jgi:hypothetical protein
VLVPPVRRRDGADPLIVRTDEGDGDPLSVRTGIGAPPPNKVSVMSRRRRRVGWLAAVLALVVMVPGGAVADAPGGEAWFPSGIGTVTAAAYPEATLHVGTLAGTETDRTYLRFDGLDDDVSSAVLTIPLAADAGTLSAETAVVAACAVPGGLDGTPETPPEVDCEGAPTAAYAADGAPSLTVDVTSLVVGDSVSLALVPGDEGGTWHVGFDSTEREGGSPPDLAVTTKPVAASPSTPTTIRPSFTTPPAATPSISRPSVTVPSAASPGAAIAEQAAPQAPTAIVPATPVVSTGGGFDYPIVFALPLVLLVVIAVAGEGLTRPVHRRDVEAAR